MIERKIVSAALIAVGVFFSLGSTSLAQSGGSMTRPQEGGSMTRPNHTSISASDRQFVNEAAQGGMTEVKLGQLALQRASSNSVKQYAQRMIDDHTNANTELMNLATQKGITVPTNLNPKYQSLVTRMSKLSGTAFDREYMREAGVNSHRQQQALFQRQAQRGQDPQLKAFAAQTLPIVQQHLKLAQDMAAGRTSSRGDNMMKK